MASSSVTRGSTVTLTGFPLIVRVIGTGPGPATLAGAGAATASLSSRPVPTAPLPRPTPRINPRRENPALGLAEGWGSFLELNTHLPFVRSRCWLDVPACEIESTISEEEQPGGGRGLFRPLLMCHSEPVRFSWV